jgi:hypothetical protein
MDHNEAIRLQAVEKYALSELPDELRDAFEDHFFECAECAADVRAAAIFADTSREIFAEENERVPEPSPVPSWWTRLRPLIAVPVLAGLLVAVYVGYRNLGPASHPGEVTVAAQLATAANIQDAVKLSGGERRGAAVAQVVRVRRGAAFTLDFDFVPSSSSGSREFDSYLGKLQDAAGHVVLAVTLAGNLVNREVHVAVPANVVSPGRYTLAFAGVPAQPGSSEKDTVVETFAFAVESAD